MRYVRLALILVLGLALIPSSAMAAEMLKEGAGPVKRPRMPAFISTGPTKSWYYFGGRLAPNTLFYFPSGGPPAKGSPIERQYPISAILEVHVRNRDGQRADGIPVALELESRSQLAGKVWVDAAKGMTEEGVFKVKVWLDNRITQQAGGNIIVRVEDLTHRMGLQVRLSPRLAN